MQTALNRAPLTPAPLCDGGGGAPQGGKGQPVPVQWTTDLKGWSLSVKPKAKANQTDENSSDARTDYPNRRTTGGANCPFEREFSSGTIPVRQPGSRAWPEQSERSSGDESQ